MADHVRAWLDADLAEQLIALGIGRMDDNSSTLYASAALSAGVYVSDGKGKVEAVDALLIDELARSRSGRSRSQWAAAHEVYREFWRGPVRQVLDQLFRLATEPAALPAGVWHSDGQGHVEPPDESVAAAALFEFAREECGWGSHEWDLCQRMAGVVLAALSATDTESSS